MHSWRVLLLPYVEANAFTGDYDFTAAWNDPANATLADGSRRHPEWPKFHDPTEVRTIYQPHLDGLSPDDLTTDFLMVVEGNEPLTDKSGIGRGPKTEGWKALDRRNPDELIIVRVRKSDVHWMEPRDIVLRSPAPDWGIPFEDIKGEIVGSVLVSGKSVKYNDREATLRLLEDRRRKAAERKSALPE